MKNKVLQQLAERMKNLKQEDPEVFEAMAEQVAQIQSLCNLFQRPDIKKSVDRIRLTSGINNLN